MTERIVVGVDGSDNAGAALTWAVEHASGRDAELEVVLAWMEPVSGGIAGAMVMPDVSSLRDAHQAELDRIVDAVRRDATDLSISGRLVHGAASSALRDAAADADLLVVGSRGHGGFAGLLLGSVSHQVVSHAPCPVVVVPSPEEGETS